MSGLRSSWRENEIKWAPWLNFSCIHISITRLQLRNIVNYWLESNVVNQCLNYFEWDASVILFYIIVFKLIFFLIFHFNFYFRFVPANDGGPVSSKRNPSILLESGHRILQQPHCSTNYGHPFSRLWWLSWWSFECSLGTRYPGGEKVQPHPYTSALEMWFYKRLSLHVWFWSPPGGEVERVTKGDGTVHFLPRMVQLLLPEGPQ